MIIRLKERKEGYPFQKGKRVQKNINVEDAFKR